MCQAPTPPKTLGKLTEKHQYSPNESVLIVFPFISEEFVQSYNIYRLWYREGHILFHKQQILHQTLAYGS